MSHHAPLVEGAFLNRRDLLRRGGMVLGALGLAGVLANSGDISHAARADATDLHPLAPKRPHFAPPIAVRVPQAREERDRGQRVLMRAGECIDDICAIRVHGRVFGELLA